MNRFFYLGLFNLFFLQQIMGQTTVSICPTPRNCGIALSDNWIVSVNDVFVPVYCANVYKDGPAYFCSFDFSDIVKVRVQPMMECARPILRPLSAGIVPEIDSNHVITFSISDPGQYSLETRHYTSGQPLLIFANPPEKNIPDPTDPSVLYYGPGYHEVTTLPVGNKTTIYLSAGAYLKNILSENEQPVIKSDEAGMSRFRPMLRQKGKQKITIKGRGIIDFSAVPWHSRQPLVFQSCTNIVVEGITILDSPIWTLTVGNSQNVLIDNIKIIGHRENSDGIDIVSSQNVIVTNCFIRTGDDGICIKSITGPSSDIRIEKSVIWNDRVRGIGIAGESMYNIKDVIFRNIDIIHDRSNFAQGCSIAVSIDYSGPVEQVLFEDIRVEDTCDKLFQVSVTDRALRQPSAKIKNITFRNIQYLGFNCPKSFISGAGNSHRVQDILFENLTFHKKKKFSAQDSNMTIGDYVDDVRFK